MDVPVVWFHALHSAIEHVRFGDILFFLTVLESGSPLSSFLEEALYKSLNE